MEDNPESTEIVANLSAWIETHHAVCHPVFDYMETTAHRAELEKFAHSELTVQRSFARHVGGGNAAKTVSTNHLLQQYYGDEKSAYAHSINAYSNLLRHALPKPNVYEERSVFSVPSDSEIALSIQSGRNRLCFDHSAIMPIVELLEICQYHKVLSGYRRVGIAPENLTEEKVILCTRKSIEAALHDILAQAPLDGMNKAMSVVHFMNWRVDYYDTLFNGILWT